MERINTPSKEEVKQIFNEIHNIWFKKHRDSKTDEEFQSMLKEAHEINKKYPYRLCENMLIDLANIIESNAKEGKDNGRDT